MDREEVSVRLAKERNKDGVAGQDSGAAVGLDGVARKEGCIVEVVLADEREDAAMEVKALGGEDGGGLEELGGVGVGRGAGLADGVLGRRATGVQASRSTLRSPLTLSTFVSGADLHLH